MPRYRKIDPRIWKDEGFRQLSRNERLITFYLITAQSNRIGILNFSPALAAEELEMSPQTFAKGFGKVCRTLRWEYNGPSRTLYIPTWWKYNCPENPNVLKSCLSDLHELPQTPLFIKFSSNLAYLPETFHQTFREGLPQPSPNQEQEQEQEQEQKQKQNGGASLSPSAQQQWLELLNRETSRQFKSVDTNFRPIRARLREGYTFAQAELVVRHKTAQWANDPKMRPYLRPSTIFGPKFDSYLAEASDNVGPHPGRTGSQRPIPREEWDKVSVGEVKL